jgi:hypothetical protein
VGRFLFFGSSVFFTTPFGLPFGFAGSAFSFAGRAPLPDFFVGRVLGLGGARGFGAALGSTAAFGLGAGFGFGAALGFAGAFALGAALGFAGALAFGAAFGFGEAFGFAIALGFGAILVGLPAFLGAAFARGFFAGGGGGTSRTPTWGGPPVPSGVPSAMRLSLCFALYDSEASRPACFWISEISVSGDDGKERGKG